MDAAPTSDGLSQDVPELNDQLSPTAPGPDVSGACGWASYQRTSGKKILALCHCGWRSDPYSSAGLAASAIDRHAAGL